MEISDLGLIVSTLLVIVGWFANSYFNKKYEKLKKQMEYRLMTLQSFMLITNSFTSSSAPFKDDKNLKSNIEKTRVYFQLYGYQDELDLYEEFIKALEESNIPKTVKTINELIGLTATRLRKELALPKIDITKNRSERDNNRLKR